MALRERCPKCETSLREGTRRCPICGSPLRFDARPAPPEVGEPVSDPLISLFDRDEMVKSCPECRNEFAREAKRCSPCRRDLRSEPRSRYAADLVERPIATAAAAATAAPPPPPKDSRKLRTCADVDEADAFVAELRVYGVDAWVADDAAEPDADAFEVDVYARADDVAAADYVLSVGKSFAPPNGGVDPSARDEILRRASAYLAHGRLRVAAALAAKLPGDPFAEETVAAAYLRCGRARDAERRAADAGAASADPTAAARLFRVAGVAFGKGARPRDALVYFDASLAARPRDLASHKALFEVLTATGAAAEAAEEVKRLRRLCPNLLATDGWFREAAIVVEQESTR
jgi:hypothetical protein